MIKEEKIDITPGISPDIGKVTDKTALCKFLIKKYKLTKSQGTLYFYDAEKGIYTADGQTRIKRVLQSVLVNQFDKRIVDEVNYYIHAALEEKELYRSSNYINLENGVYNVEAGTLEKHCPDFFTNIRIPVVYNPEKKCPAISAFFETTLSEETIPLIEEMFGYCLTQDTKYEKAFMILGGGANGKSTMLKLLQRLLGDGNYSAESLQALSSHQFRIPSLVGKLANIFADLPLKNIDDAGVFKTLVSGDIISVRRTFSDPFPFRNTAKLIFSTNKMPVSSDVSQAFFRRIIILRFSKCFNGINADVNLIKKLTTRDEMSGLLNRSLSGLERLHKRGHFSITTDMEHELRRYRLINDSVREYVSSECKMCEGLTIPVIEFYAHYKRFCQEQGIIPRATREFSAILITEYSLQKRRLVNKDTSRPWVWDGIAPIH